MLDGQVGFDISAGGYKSAVLRNSPAIATSEFVLASNWAVANTVTGLLTVGTFDLDTFDCWSLFGTALGTMTEF